VAAAGHDEVAVGKIRDCEWHVLAYQVRSVGEVDDAWPGAAVELPDGDESTLRSDLDMLATVTAPDPATVVFSLKYAYAPFLQRLTLGVVPAKLLSGQEINKAGSNR
jgi:ABC-type transport system substrate-binding protein